MATPTFDLLDSVTLSSSASSVTFSGISGTGKGDLMLVTSIIPVDTGNKSVFCTINSDSGANYPFVQMQGNGSSASSYGATDSYLNIASGNKTGGSINTAQFFDFAATDKHKSVLSRQNVASGFTGARAHRWANTAAITSLTMVLNDATSFDVGSTFYLYQIVSE